MTRSLDESGAGWFALPATLEIDDEHVALSEMQRLTFLGYVCRMTRVLKVGAEVSPETGAIRDVGQSPKFYLEVNARGAGQ